MGKKNKKKKKESPDLKQHHCQATDAPQPGNGEVNNKHIQFYRDRATQFLEDYEDEYGNELPLGHEYDKENFVKFHILINDQKFKQNMNAGLYPGLDKKTGTIVGNDSSPFPPYTLSKMTYASTPDFLYHLKRVGEYYGWDKRNRYQANEEKARARMDEMMKDPSSAIYLFNWLNPETIQYEQAGFCTVTGINRETQRHYYHEQGEAIKKSQVIALYLDDSKSAAVPYDVARLIEINKIGLYPEYTNSGHGQPFLAMILYELLGHKQKSGNYNVVYLDTRSSNHPGVVPYYIKNGCKVQYTEKLRSDILGDKPTLDLDAANEHTLSTLKKTIGGGSTNGTVDTFAAACMTGAGDLGFSSLRKRHYDDRNRGLQRLGIGLDREHEKHFYI